MHRDRHIAKGSQSLRKDSMLGHTQASPVTESGEPLQTAVGPYGLLSGASSNQIYHGTHSSPQPYVSQQNFPPFAEPEDFMKYLFGGKPLDSYSSPMGQTGQQRNEKLVSISHILLYTAHHVTRYPNAQNQYYAPHFADDISPGGFFPANQQSHNPMAVTSLLNPSRLEMENVPPEINPIPSAGDPLPSLHTLGVENPRSTAYPVEGDMNFVFDAGVPGFFTTIDGDQNLASPPETSQASDSDWPIPKASLTRSGTSRSQTSLCTLRLMIHSAWSYRCPNQPICLL
jgi:hypothetical protein